MFKFTLLFFDYSCVFDFQTGVRVDTPDAEHMTALHLASQRGLAEVVTLLLESGSKVNNKMNDKVRLIC